MTLVKVSLVFLNPSSRRSVTRPLIWSSRVSTVPRNCSEVLPSASDNRSPCFARPSCRSLSISRCFSSISFACCAKQVAHHCGKNAEPDHQKGHGDEQDSGGSGDQESFGHDYSKVSEEGVARGMLYHLPGTARGDIPFTFQLVPLPFGLALVHSVLITQRLSFFLLSLKIFLPGFSTYPADSSTFRASFCLDAPGRTSSCACSHGRFSHGFGGIVCGPRDRSWPFPCPCWVAWFFPASACPGQVSSYAITG